MVRVYFLIYSFIFICIVNKMSYKLRFHHIPAFFRAQISLKSARSYGLVGPRILFWTCFAEDQ